METGTEEDKKIGIALVISNGYFTDPNCGKRRRGAENDKTLLTETFKELGFEVCPFFNLTSTEMIKMAREVKKHIQKTRTVYEHLVVAVSSHGACSERRAEDVPGLDDIEFREGVDLIHGTDGAIAVELLTETFSEKECSKLAGKPKLFFIQACRGTELANTVTINSNTGTTISAKSDATIDRSQTTMDSCRCCFSPDDNSDDDDIVDGEGSDTCNQNVTLKESPGNSHSRAIQATEVHMDKSNMSDSEQMGRGEDDVTKQMDEKRLGDDWIKRIGDPVKTCEAPGPTLIVSETVPYQNNDSTKSTNPIPTTLDKENAGECSPVKEPVQKEIVVSRRNILRKDYLLMWSSPPGYFAFHSKDGSPFIRFLCEELSTQYGDKDLLTMLTNVNWKVASGYACNSRYPEYHGRHIVPSIENQLRHRVYLTLRNKQEEKEE